MTKHKKIEKIKVGDKVYIKDFGKTVVGYWNWIVVNEIAPKFYKPSTDLSNLTKDIVEGKKAKVVFCGTYLNSKKPLYFLRGKDFEVIAPKEALVRFNQQKK